MNVTSTRPYGRVHYPATSGTRPQCAPNDTRSSYRTTDGTVTCEKCLIRPACLDELWHVAHIAVGAAALQERSLTFAVAALAQTKPGTPAYRITQSALLAVRASQQSVEQAAHYAAAAYIARARELRVPGRQFLLDDVERRFADLPEVVAIIAGAAN